MIAFKKIIIWGSERGKKENYFKFVQDITGLSRLAQPTVQVPRCGPLHIMEMPELEVWEEGAGDGALRTPTLGERKEKPPSPEAKGSQREERGEPERPAS